MNNEKTIAIIGAGPAGITCALELKKRGFKNITIFGKFEEAQCRSLHIGGVVADVGTCYLHSGYWNTVKPLVREFGLHLNYLEAPTLINDRGETPRLRLHEKVETLLGLLFFIGLSFKWLFTYRSEKSRRYGVPMEDYLRAHRLGKFSQSFVLGPGGIAQGYGFLDEVTAYGAFRWFRPSIFVTVVANKLRRGTATIREGYGVLFQKILSGLNHRPELARSVAPSEIGPRPTVAVTTEGGEALFFDHVVVACPPGKVQSPLSSVLPPGSVRSTRFFSFLWTSATPPWFADRVYFTDEIRSKSRDKILSFRVYGQTDEGLYVYWGAGYATENTPKPMLETRLRTQIEQSCRTDIERVHFFEVFDYNLRFSAGAVRDGLHLTIDRMQGQGNIWYTGGLLSHWDVDSIQEHNRSLATQLAFRETPPGPLRNLLFRARAIANRFREI